VAHGKGNQSTLRRALAALPWAQAPGHRRRQTAHGRTESRSVKVIDLDGSPTAALLPHAARAIKVVRRRRDNRIGKTSAEVVYAVTSLTYRQADPHLLACWIQGASAQRRAGWRAGSAHASITAA
jgi:hypothetical protein